MKQIKDIDKKLEKVDAQLAKSEDFISKLNNVEKRLEKLVEVEKIVYEKDCKIEELTRKVDNIEEKLAKTIALIDQNSNKPKKPQLKISCEECEFKQILDKVSKCT